ncbi:Serine/threonine-protein kinase [Coemansia sp. RSA 1199]|nr:Serine/threonine-protein kinase [Coemansia sp. RSA 1199]
MVLHKLAAVPRDMSRAFASVRGLHIMHMYTAVDNIRLVFNSRYVVDLRLVGTDLFCISDAVQSTSTPSKHMHSAPKPLVTATTEPIPLFADWLAAMSRSIKFDWARLERGMSVVLRDVVPQSGDVQTACERVRMFQRTMFSLRPNASKAERMLHECQRAICRQSSARTPMFVALPPSAVLCTHLHLVPMLRSLMQWLVQSVHVRDQLEMAITRTQEIVGNDALLSVREKLVFMSDRKKEEEHGQAMIVGFTGARESVRCEFLVQAGVAGRSDQSDHMNVDTPPRSTEPRSTEPTQETQVDSENPAFDADDETTIQSLLSDLFTIPSDLMHVDLDVRIVPMTRPPNGITDSAAAFLVKSFKAQTSEIRQRAGVLVRILSLPPHLVMDIVDVCRKLTDKARVCALDDGLEHMVRLDGARSAVRVLVRVCVGGEWTQLVIEYELLSGVARVVCVYDAAERTVVTEEPGLEQSQALQPWTARMDAVVAALDAQAVFTRDMGKTGKSRFYDVVHASHALVAAADLQPPLGMGVGGLETELGETVQHIRMLGSTRFMKTILCKLPNEGQLVLHVFMRPVSMPFDVTLQISALRSQYAKLSGTHRLLWHTQVMSDDRAVYILRQHLHNNLYDRVSTRPFLSTNEKRWIASQMLTALREAHERGVCHGDVKSENIVMTSWNLVYLADFAPFKPTYLPADDPAEFNFYFDTAARQCCCIAPERFYDPGSSISQLLAASGSSMGGEDRLTLQPSMDIFSAGCVIAELFLDGNPLFSLSRLLQYRKGAVTAAALLADIPDKEAAALVEHMIQRDPEARLTAAGYLDRWAPIFPDAPLAAYMDRASPDVRMRALFDETENVADSLCEITASIACANVRNCSLPSSRCMGIKVLLRCSRGAMRGDPDLVLPYLVALALDPSPRVRAEAVVATRDLLVDLQRLTPINANIFDDYLAPHLQYFASDISVGVRCMVASVLGDLADTSYFLTGGHGTTDFLNTQIRTIVGKLSFDEAEVKHVLLCSFPQLYERGVQSLSHIITYLNDRDCWFLRAAFFDVVFAASAQISRHASREYIVPLINLNDHEVFVVVSALRALVRLVPQMSPAMLWDKLVEVQAFGTGPLKRSAHEFTEFVFAHAKLPMSTDIARLALDIAKPATSNSYDGVLVDVQDDLGEDMALGRIIQLREIGAALKTVFLTPVKDPWAGPSSSTAKADDSADKAGDNATELADKWQGVVQETDRAMGAFLHKKALELEFPAQPRRQRLDGWRPQGTLLAEVSEHNDAVTCVVATNSALFMTGSEDGTVRLFDASVFRKSAVCRSRATHFQGGRITSLAYHSALNCTASSSDNGSICVLRAESNELRVLATATLPKGEHAVALGYGKGPRGVSLVACTSRSRVVFYGIVDLAEQEAVELDPSLGLVTSMASDGAALAVVGTSKGCLQLIDTRFRLALRQYRHFMSHYISSVTMYSDDGVLVGTAAGDVCVLNLRTGNWPMCVCSRSLQELKGDEVKRRQRINTVAVTAPGCFVAGSNDGMVRFWDSEKLDRSYVVNSAETAPPYSSYRLNGTVYYCENTGPSTPRSPPSPAGARLASDVASAVAANSSRPGGPVTAMAILGSPSVMLVTGLQSGAIRVLV